MASHAGTAVRLTPPIKRGSAGLVICRGVSGSRGRDASSKGNYGRVDWPGLRANRGRRILAAGNYSRGAV